MRKCATLLASSLVLGCQTIAIRTFHDYKNANSQCHNHIYLGTREGGAEALRSRDLRLLLDLPLTCVADTLMLPWDLSVALIAPYGDCNENSSAHQHSPE